MTRKFAIILLAVTLPLTACKEVRLPFLKKKSQETTGTEAAPSATATPAPAAAKSEVAKPAAPPKPEVNTQASVMVLCYHNIEDKGGQKSLTISVAEFERQLQAIKDGGFTVIGMQDFLAWRRGEKDIPMKSCVITIDDGWVSGYTDAWPVLKKFGYPFTLFVYVNYISTGGKSLTWEQLAEMRDAGVDIQSHTYSHANLRAPTKSPLDARNKALIMKDLQTLGQEGWLRKEIVESKLALEKQLGIKVNALAYPFGIYSPEAREMVKEAGYEAAFTVYGQRLTHSSPFDLLGRYAVEAAKPAIFQAALTMVGGGGGAGAEPVSTVAQLAASSMLTHPADGETISDPKPVLKANLATMGEIEPGSVAVRVSGVGAVTAKYDPATKNLEAPITQPLRDKHYTVILSAKAGGRKVETSWSFNFDPNAKPGAAVEPPLPTRPAR